MSDKDRLLIEYFDKIQDIPLEKVATNELNPREKFVEGEEDQLIESILTKGILNPIIVYKRKKDDKFVILDGERRFRATSKLNMRTIPAHVLVREPSTLENLSMMFHIHNVREEWTDFAIALSLKRIVEEMGKNVRKLSKEELKEIQKTTSLSEYKIRKYLKFLDYPGEVVDVFLKSEMSEKPTKGVDPDILAEMHKPITQMRKDMPEILKKYSVSQMISACILKKKNGVISTNKEFRLLSKALTAAKKKEIRPQILREKIELFFENSEITPTQVYQETSATIYQLKEIFKQVDQLENNLSNLDLRKITSDEKIELSKKLSRLSRLLKYKYSAE